MQYDHQAIEKHILDKFIHGKPRILSDIPQVMYRRDVYTTVTFDAVRKKVNPQVSLQSEYQWNVIHHGNIQVKLEPQAQKEVLSELRTPDRLRENLDVVDIVIGFLSSGGGKPEKPLGDYIDRVLKMKRRSFSLKVIHFAVYTYYIAHQNILASNTFFHFYRLVSTAVFIIFSLCGRFSLLSLLGLLGFKNKLDYS